MGGLDARIRKPDGHWSNELFGALPADRQDVPVSGAIQCGDFDSVCGRDGLLDGAFYDGRAFWNGDDDQ